MPRVTVLLRTLNAGEEFVELLQALRAQSLQPLELLVVDSGSTDGTRERALEAGARIVDIDRRKFTHAVSTNLGFREAKGEIVAMLSQDALPLGSEWLRTLIAPLSEPEVAAVFGRQAPRSDCFPLERWELERAYPEQGTPGVVYSNVNSAARRRVWEALPFPEEVLIAEDRLWALALAERDHRVAYVPEAVVRHSHAYTLREVYARCRAEAESRRRADGHRDPWWVMFTAWPKQILSDARRLGAEGRFGRWPHAAAYRFAQFAGLVAGGRS